MSPSHPAPSFLPPELTRTVLQSLLSNPLLIHNLPEAASFDRSHLQLPPSISPLRENQKLGHLIEDAVAILLHASPSVTILEQNLQLQENRHNTVGELDYLIRCHSTGHLIHLELAAKFYLAHSTPAGTTFPGPDTRDNYGKKLNRLRTHQLQLAHTHRALLPTAYTSQPIVPQQLIYGCIFDHISTSTPAAASHLSPRCTRGKWLQQKDLSTHLPPNTPFAQVPKPLWLIHPSDLSSHTRATLTPWDPNTPLTRVTMVSHPGQTVPLFIAPDSYPNQETT